MQRDRIHIASVRRGGLSAILVSIWVAAGIVFPQTGCMDPFDPASSLGDSFLVLALRSEPRTVSAGQALELTALEYMPPASHVDPEQIWVTCLPERGEGPQACLGAALGQIEESLSACRDGCLSDLDQTSCEQRCSSQTLADLLCSSTRPERACVAGYGPSARYELPTGFSQDVFFVYLLASVGEDGLQGCFDQWSQTAQTTFPAPTAECTISFKRIPVGSENEQPDPNPRIPSVTVGSQTTAGRDIVLHPEDIDTGRGRILLQATADADDNSYISWFTDCGTLDHGRTFGPLGDNSLDLKQRSICSLFVVVRDSHYGVGWLSVKLDPTAIDLP